MPAWQRLRSKHKAKAAPALEPVVFPEPASLLPPEPRPFVGAEHRQLVRSLQSHVSMPCLVAVVGPIGVGKSAICEKLINTAESRRDFLTDEDGEPVHRRFWVDLDECGPGAAVEERVARSLACPTFDAALQRLTTGRRCLLVLDNADHAWSGAPVHDPVLAQLAACVDHGARIVMTMRSIERLSPRLAWTAEVHVPRFAESPGAELFGAWPRSGRKIPGR